MQGMWHIVGHYRQGMQAPAQGTKGRIARMVYACEMEGRRKMNDTPESDFDTVAKALDRMRRKAGEARKAVVPLETKVEYSRLENKLANMRRDFLLLAFVIEDAEKDSQRAVFCETCGAQDHA
jgi:hypothetical protein